MIEKERLEELIKQEASIYWRGGRKIKPSLWNKYTLWDSAIVKNNLAYIYDYVDLFETKEEAEFALKYQNITRTETLSLPTFEEFCKYEYVDFTTSKGKHCWLEICLDSPTSRFRMAEGSMFTHIWDLTKENYFTACELCKKLFLGEEV